MAETSRTHAGPGNVARADIATVMDAMRSIVQALRVSGREAEQLLGISSAQLYVLKVLSEHLALSINELAERSFTHQSSVSMVVTRLVEAGLVTRKTSSADGRRMVISLTPAGKTILRRSPDAAQSKLIDALEGMSRTDLHSLARSLGMVSDMMTEEETPRRSTRKPSLHQE